MRFILARDDLLKPVQIVNGIVERRQALPILANTLLVLKDGVLSLTTTDMEVELTAQTTIEDGADGEITVPARKFIDICRSLPSGSNVEFSVEADRGLVRCGRSRFTLATLPAADYPIGDPIADVRRLRVPQGELKRLIELTQFAMAQQDVRYYLNGMLLELFHDRLRAVATDGHRLATAEISLSEVVDLDEETSVQIIVPRKGILELGRLLEAGEEPVDLTFNSGALRATVANVLFTTKLVDGRFPDYQRVIPAHCGSEKHVAADRETVRQSLARTSILSNEKYRAIKLDLRPNVLHIVASNPEQEEAEDEVEVEFEGEPLAIGFNVSYLIEALANVPTERVSIYLTDAGSSCLIEPEGRDDCQYVVMPMRL